MKISIAEGLLTNLIVICFLIILFKLQFSKGFTGGCNINLQSIFTNFSVHLNRSSCLNYFHNTYKVHDIKLSLSYSEVMLMHKIAKELRLKLKHVLLPDFVLFDSVLHLVVKLESDFEMAV